MALSNSSTCKAVYSFENFEAHIEVPKLKSYSKTVLVGGEKKYFNSFIRIYLLYICMQHLVGSLVVLLHPTLVQVSLQDYAWILQIF